ncbi:hypothetical protein [Amycolatopsis thermophila]|uniref:Uncharacterized protein n=1 Tax=Amycolatopsis thermophila TaxID=206084 RepID=A0ABU0EMH5_9PSEU|nr:hypothetical protein [Amycolatopsis thermophila]MDQ0376467.1 hypothetical protein [Amycolatopsis thermophila]
MSEKKITITLPECRPDSWPPLWVIRGERWARVVGGNLEIDGQDVGSMPAVQRYALGLALIASAYDEDLPPDPDAGWYDGQWRGDA